jgi:Holliday junction DNA helicase RuvA
MIGHLRGHLAEKRPNLVVVDVNGVGYQVAIPVSIFYSLGELRDEVIPLILFKNRTFNAASGVGPVLALKILSGMSVDDLVPAIRANDLVRLVRIPGVGRKTAERIVVELRDKIAAMAAPEPEHVAAAGLTGLHADVISALLNLGYERSGAEKAVQSAAARTADGNESSFEALLRATLQQLSQPAQKGARRDD